MNTLAFRAFTVLKKLHGRARDIRAGLERRTGLSGSSELPDVLPRPIPKNLWIYWAQGEQAAPPIVRLCIESWRRRNPTWAIHVLDDRSLDGVVAIPLLPEGISIAHRADVLRVCLLAEHGGVWADATAYCSRPLDDWLPLAAQSGFFCFAWTRADRGLVKVGPHRAIGNWFLASEPAGYMIAALKRATLTYWEGRTRADSYYWQHFLFEWLVATDRRFRLLWHRTPRLGALPIHYVFHWMKTGKRLDLARRAVGENIVPMHKLTWRHAPDPATIVDALGLQP